MSMTRNRANRKTGGRPKGVADAPATTVGQCRQQLKSGYKLLKKRKANLPAHSQPPAEGGSVFFNNGARLLVLAFRHGIW